MQNEDRGVVPSRNPLTATSPKISAGTNVSRVAPSVNKRIRLEIIFSQALEEDVKQLFSEKGIGKKFTKFETVMGAGDSNPRLGDAVWPQLNMMYVIYCDKDEAKKIHSVVTFLRKKYLTEGIACFMSQAIEL